MFFRFRLQRLCVTLCLPLLLLVGLYVDVSQARPSISEHGVIISEVAWGGTAASSFDEWIELHNLTENPLDLSGWTLSFGAEVVTLTGSIDGAGFYLLERTDDEAVSDVPADQTYTGGLSNGGETLTLKDAGGQVVDVANTAGGEWPAGTASPDYRSMERAAPTPADSWVSNTGATRNGQDKDGNPINGTPQQPNEAWNSDIPPVVTATVLIDAVLYRGQANGQGDEAVALRNIDETVAPVGGWRLSDGGTAAVLPAGTTLAPGQLLWMAKDAVAFRDQFGFAPHLESEGTDPAVPDLMGGWPGFADSGGAVILRDSADAIQDVLVYEDGSTAVAGWTGAAVEPYKLNNSTAVRGQILYRRRDPQTALPVPDTNSAADWAQHTGDVINGRKVRYPGWVLDQFFFTTRFTETAVLTVAVAPDNAYETLTRQINAAQESIQIETHTFENLGIADALVDALERGVQVTILLEGGPPGGLDDQQKYICRQIEAAGGACWFMINDRGSDIYDRYTFIHAKFILIDGRIAIVGSENLSPNSLPTDDKSDGTWGRRGVILLTDAPGVVDHLQTIFAADFDPAVRRDIFRYADSHATYGGPPVGYVPMTQTGGITYTLRYTDALSFQGTFGFEIVQSPENSLRALEGLLGLVNRAGAGDTVLVQQLAERPYWGVTESNAQDDPNPRLEAYIDAARRGATVRILLDEFFETVDDPVGNRATCEAVRLIAAAERLDLKCRLGNPTGLGIHNKMVLVEVDGRGFVHVGSINGTEASNKTNRELALQVQSDGLFDLLADMFTRDWPHRAFLPVVYQDFLGPVQYPLISELLYDPVGPDSAEFIELANPTGTAVDLAQYSLSDAITVTDFADLRRFPTNTLILPQDTLVIAQQATAFFEQYGTQPDYEILDTDPAVPDLIDDPAWGDSDTFLQLGNSGDFLFLRDPLDRLVDSVAYSSEVDPSGVTCALVPSGHSLRRTPYWRDTDVCPADFEAWPSPDPGILP